MAVYIFERITIIKGGRGKFIDLMRRKWGPQNEAKHGVHMAGLWATAGQTADWPEANVLIDANRPDPGGLVPDYNATVRVIGL